MTSIDISIGKPTPRSFTKLCIKGPIDPNSMTFWRELPGAQMKRGLLWLPLEPRVYELFTSQHRKVRIAPEVAKWYADLQAADRPRVEYTTLKDVELAGIDARLRSYQRVGVNFILNVPRCILADDVGLGKTAQVIEAIELSGQATKVLVVCPKNVMYWWADEIERWFPGQARLVLEANKRKKTFASYEQGFLILNWELVQRMPELREHKWNWLIGDEAHRLKNSKTNTWRSFARLPSDRLVLMTGTPLTNTPGDLWALLHLIEPPRFPSYWRFFEMYVNYSIAWHGFPEIDRKHPVRNPKLLQREIAPIMIRRNKESYRDVLPPQYRSVPLQLTPRQRTLYKQMAKQMVAELANGETLEVFDVAVQLLRLRQILSTTATLEESDHSSKLDAAVELIEDSPEEQFVVFALFRNTIFSLQRRLAEKKIPCAIIIGEQSAQDRYDAAQAFQAGDIRVILSTIQAGGEAVTLTAARQVVFIEKHYSPTAQRQAIGRVDRFGQTKQCMVTSFFCPDTVDELVEEILEAKVQMIETVLRDKLRISLQKSLKEL